MDIGDLIIILFFLLPVIARIFRSKRPQQGPEDVDYREYDSVEDHEEVQHAPELRDALEEIGRVLRGEPVRKPIPPPPTPAIKRPKLVPQLEEFRQTESLFEPNYPEWQPGARDFSALAPIKPLPPPVTEGRGRNVAASRITRLLKENPQSLKDAVLISELLQRQGWRPPEENWS